MHDKSCCKNLSDEGFRKIKEAMPDESVLFSLADFYKVFGDSTRIKIIYALFAGEMCVGTIANLLEMSQSSISHQLRVLKTNRLVKSRKEGKQVYYTLDDMHVQQIYKMGIDHINERGL